jgi:DNA-binding transcriptional ArsR family regulator
VDGELDLLLGRVIDDLVKLNVTLYLHAEEGAYSPEDIAMQVRRPPETVARALAALAEAGIVERFALGTGRFVMYGASEDAHIAELLDLLDRRYRGDAGSRAEVVRRVLRVAAEDDAQLPPDQ